MNFPFKITEESGLYQYLHIKASPEYRTLKDSNLQMQVYLTLAKRLSVGLNAYALLPFSPDIAELWPGYIPVNYKYRFLANDFNGLGIDQGFQRLEDGSPLMVIFALKDLMTLRSIPEDCFGDRASSVSLIFVHAGREAALKALLQGEGFPDLGTFLMKNELFVHLTCGKEQGFYDGLLLHSLTDISAQVRGAIQLTQTAGLL